MFGGVVWGFLTQFQEGCEEGFVNLKEGPKWGADCSV